MSSGAVHFSMNVERLSKKTQRNRSFAVRGKAELLDFYLHAFDRLLEFEAALTTDEQLLGLLEALLEVCDFRAGLLFFFFFFQKSTMCNSKGCILKTQSYDLL